MRLRLVCRDREYMQALMDVLSTLEPDLYIEVPNERLFDGLDRNTIILTDYMPEDFNMPLPEALRRRTVFLTTNIDRLESNNDGKIYIFKYMSLKEIVAELADIYFELTGELIRHRGYARIFYVCTDSESINTSDYCKTIARQIIYRKNAKVLILPLTYINEYACREIADNSCFSRLMYYMEIEKNYSEGSYFFDDEYGVRSLRLADGINPIAYMKNNEINRVINNLAKNNEIIIIDVGTNYSLEVIDRLKSAEKVFLIKGHGNDCLKESILEDITDDAYVPIEVTGGYDAAELIIDEKICEILNECRDEKQ